MKHLITSTYLLLVEEMQKGFSSVNIRRSSYLNFLMCHFLWTTVYSTHCAYSSEGSLEEEEAEADACCDVVSL